MRETEVVYIATNDHMPTVIKIGRTEDERTLEQRMKALSHSTGVPGEYKCVYACETPKSKKVEPALHNILKQAGKSSSKEFFNKDCMQMAKDILSMVKTRDINLIKKEIGEKNITTASKINTHTQHKVEGKRVSSWKTSLKSC